MIAELVSALALVAPAPPATIIAAGDIGSCRSRGDEATAALVARLPGTIAVLGDAVYESGTADEFARCYAWRRFRARTRAALGNHEYGVGSANAAIEYFGLPRDGYYSFELGAWHVVVLNTNCARAGGCGGSSPQNLWLRQDLAAHPAACTLATMHHPRWSSGIHGSNPTIDPIWRTLAAGGVDLVLAGHDHDYERFAPIEGIRSFVVGTGGRSLYPVLRRLPRSAALHFRTYGVLRLTLRQDDYDWRFLPVRGSTFADSGSGDCR